VVNREPKHTAFSDSGNSASAMDLDEEVSGEGASAVYAASRIKRGRATKAEIQDRRQALYGIVDEQKPMTVRQTFYQGSVRDIVEKSEPGYSKVQRTLVSMRRDGMLPYDWLADNTRWQRKPTTYNSIEQALRETARLYRRAMWADADCYVEIWLEKDALAGVILPVTDSFDVPLMVARGYSSLSFLYSAAEHIKTVHKPAFIYHLGDYDPSGVNAGEKIDQTLREMAPEAEIHFKRLAVNPDQIRAWNLPTRPTKKTDSRAKGFGDISVELDAIAPDQLRRLVKDAIVRHVDPALLTVIYAAEEDEKRLINGLVGMVQGSRHG
jgi:hypothetical protein